MDNRRGTPRHASDLPAFRWAGVPVALAVVAALLVAGISVARCSDGASSIGAGRNVPLVVEATSEEALRRQEYIDTWGARIDAYNEGYPLEGYGATFAAAAYDYGVDPRISPAIARVESGSGENCFRAHNAWGWGSTSWSDWDTAIWAHVEGLATDYGSTLTYEFAQKYNRVNTDEWYAQVSACMAEIWEDDSPTQDAA